MSHTPESSCGLDHISTCFSCSFLDLSHDSKDGNVDIFNKLSMPEYAGINMIHMPQVDSNVSGSFLVLIDEPD